MANNTTLNTMSGGDVISDDQLTTLNGSAIATGEKAQRMKLTYGAVGVGVDVTTSNGMPVQGISAPTTTASWTSATTVNTAASMTVMGMNVVSVIIAPTSTFTAGAITFEVSIDNTNWVSILMARIDSYTTETAYTISASINRAWSTSVDGFNYFRVRLSTAIAGTGTASIAVVPQAFAIEPIVNVGQSVASNLQATAILATGSNTAGAFYITGRNTGGATSFTLNTAASTNATSVKTSAATLFSLNLSNSTTTAAFFKLYNKASAPTVGTDTPVKTIMIPASSTVSVALPSQGIALATGLAYAVTGALAAADTTAVAANQVAVNGSYV